jgi:LysM repeat protein
MPKKIPFRLLIGSLTAASIYLLLTVVPAQAGPASSHLAQPTAYQTSTPLPDGTIIYVVQEGDTLWYISAITGVPIAELEELNSIHREDPLQPGTQLIIARVTPTVVEPTVAFQPTVTSTPLPVSGKGTLCVSMFDDINGDGTWQQGSEGLMGGGQISVALTDGTEMASYTTDGINEPHCFDNLPAGDYSIAAAAPNGYNPTAKMNKPLTLAPGDVAHVSFSVQTSHSNPDGGGGGSFVLGLIGIALLGGAGFLIYTMMRPRRIDRW